DFQIELGFFSETDKNSTITNRSVTQPNISVKYGLFEWLEVRVLTNYLTEISNAGMGETRVSGITPLTLSPKFKILEQEGFFSKLSIGTSFTLPNVGASAFQNNQLNFGYRVLMENALTDKLSWSHGLGTDWDDNKDANWVYSSSFGIVLTEKLSAFTELYGDFTTVYNSYHLDGGVTYMVLNNVVVDAMVGAGLNTSNYFISFGVSWKTNFKK
ncbi:MAG: transporter, partial [Cyclobacteriaceae bacterium]|nr:transporter [Cyclobacteriaceae bacterium]